MQSNHHLQKTFLYTSILILTVIFKDNWFVLGLSAYLLFRMSFIVVSDYFRERIDSLIYRWFETDKDSPLNKHDAADEPKRFQFNILHELKYKKSIPYILLFTILINLVFVSTLLIDNIWVKSGILMLLVVVYSQFYQQFYKSTAINKEYQEKLGI